MVESLAAAIAWSGSIPRLFGDAEGIYNPLVKAWWDGTGFAGRCPACKEWIHFTTLGMEAIDESKAQQLPRLPENRETMAAFG